LIVVALALLSLALLTVYFRESSSGPVHRLQGYGSQGTRPFQVVADRIAQPFQDAYHWAHDMRKTKKENEKLRAQLEKAQQTAAQYRNDAAKARGLQAVLRFEHSPRFPDDYDPVNAEVMTPASGPFEQAIVIAGGENREIRVDDTVINEDGLVGRISQVGPTTSKVALLSDPSFAVSALDLSSKTDAQGIVRHPATGSDVLMLDGVKVALTVEEGDSIVTSGWRRDDLHSLYPAGITIGRITSYSQNDVNPDKQIQVEPSVDFSSLDAVIVLIPKTRGVNGP